MDPIYTRENCRFSYPLQWSLTIFWRAGQIDSFPLGTLKTSLELDGIRILNHRYIDQQTSQFALSTKPHVSPEFIVQRVKGRLQYLVRDQQPKPFQRNYAIRSFGSEERSVIESYVGSQLDHHHYGGAEFEDFIASLQFEDSTIDLSKPRKTSHGLFWYNLHVVMVNRERWNVGDKDLLLKIRSMVLRVAKVKGWLISRAAVLPDHIHLSISCSFNVAPDEVAICYLNNLASVYEMKRVFQFGAYIGTFGEYDNRAVKS